MEATTPELGPVGFWSPKFSSFSSSDSIVVEKAARNCLSPRPSINKSGAPNFFIQHDKVEDSKLHRYLDTCGRACVCLCVCVCVCVCVCECVCLPKSSYTCMWCLVLSLV